MALSSCNTTVDSMGRELVEHGTSAFPIACYYDDLRRSAVSWHWHEELEAAIITEGTAIVAAGTSRQVLSAGNGFFINSGILHGAWSLDTSSCHFHSLVFHADLVSGHAGSSISQHYVKPLITNTASDLQVLSADVPWQKTALEAIESAWQACVREDPGYEFSVRSHLSGLVFQLWQHMDAGDPPSGVKALRDAHRIKTMLSFVHDHFGDDLTVSDIAASAAVSDSECLRCFRNSISTTPIRYLKQHRIRIASRLLLSTQDPISDIAARCGFQDMSYFTKSFREKMHCTPTQYRTAERLE